MTVSDPNGDIIFARNAQDITVSGLSVPVTVSLSGLEVGTFEPDPSGRLVLPLREMLENYPFSDIDPDGNNSLCSLIAITIDGEEDDSQTVTHTVLKGGALSGIPGLLGELLTPCPQIQSVYSWSKIFACCLSLSDHGQGRTCTASWIEADIWFRTAGKRNLTICAFEPAVLAAVACERLSLPYLMALAMEDYDDISENDIILAFDISVVSEYGDGSSARGKSLRFVVQPSKSDFREFFFRNSLGVIDQVHSRGKLAGVPEYEYSNFVDRNVWSQEGVSMADWHSVHTGRFRSLAEQLQWEGFFMSDKHFIMDQKGRIREIIITDVKMETVSRETSEASFKYRLSKDDAGQEYERTDIKPFEYDSDVL